LQRVKAINQQTNNKAIAKRMWLCGIQPVS